MRHRWINRRRGTEPREKKGRIRKCQWAIRQLVLCAGGLECDCACVCGILTACLVRVCMFILVWSAHWLNVQKSTTPPTLHYCLLPSSLPLQFYSSKLKWSFSYTHIYTPYMVAAQPSYGQQEGDMCLICFFFLSLLFLLLAVSLHKSVFAL